MDWLNLHIPSVVRSPEFVGSAPAERGIWLSVLAYACEIECGGVLAGAALWKDQQWQQACGVTLRQVRAATRLLRVVGEDVQVCGYPLAAEKHVQGNRKNARAGAMARWGKVLAVPGGNAEPMPPGMPGGNAKGEGEGEGEGEVAPASAAASPPPLSGEGDRWPYEQSQPWAMTLRRANCRIGRSIWLAWKALCDRYGADRVAELAQTIPAAERWPDRTEDALKASRGQVSIEDAVARKTEKVSL